MAGQVVDTGVLGVVEHRRHDLGRDGLAEDLDIDAGADVEIGGQLGESDVPSDGVGLGAAAHAADDVPLEAHRLTAVEREVIPVRVAEALRGRRSEMGEGSQTASSASVYLAGANKGGTRWERIASAGGSLCQLLSHRKWHPCRQLPADTGVSGG